MLSKVGLKWLISLLLVSIASTDSNTTQDETATDYGTATEEPDVIIEMMASANQTSLAISYNNGDLIKKACDCKCKCCLQLTFSCENYCICVEGREPRQQQCIGGLLFNPDIQNCDLPANVLCNPRPTSPPTLKCEKEEDYKKFPGNCSLFIQCANFHPYVHYCGAGLHFCDTCDPPRCEYPVLANCTAENKYKPKSDQANVIRRIKRSVESSQWRLPCPTKFGFHPYPGQPRSYYKCYNGHPTGEIQCPPTLTFNPAISACSRL